MYGIEHGWLLYSLRNPHGDTATSPVVHAPLPGQLTSSLRTTALKMCGFVTVSLSARTFPPAGQLLLGSSPALPAAGVKDSGV